MFDKQESDFFAGDGLDLGNAFADMDGFTPFNDPEAEAIFGTDKKPEVSEPVNQSSEEVIASQTEFGGVQKSMVPPMNPAFAEEVKTEVKNEKVTMVQSTAAEAKPAADVKETNDISDLFAQTLADAAKKQAESTKSSLIEKLPIFSYGGAKDEIVDISKTFDELRKEKAEDFPEFDDESSVSWKMTYGTITKSVPTPKKSTISALKKQIEGSKEFMTMLVKAQGKDSTKKSAKSEEISCIVAPSVVAKKKGVASYKGAFLTPDEAKRSGKVISYVPSDDGKVYEIRSHKIGTFIAEADNVTMLKKVRAGFIPALPKIPYERLSEIIAFFKAYMSEKNELEALAYIYWSFQDSKYFTFIPPQWVAKAEVKSYLPEIDENVYALVMEVHSHNSMLAEFSYVDDKDERATRLYTVIGRLNKVFPDIKTRISVGGKFVEVEPSEIFEGIDGSFPEKWKNAVEESRRVKEEVSV